MRCRVWSFLRQNCCPPAGPHTRGREMRDARWHRCGADTAAPKGRKCEKGGATGLSELDTHQGRLRSASGPETSSRALSPAPWSSSTECRMGCRDRGQKQQDAWDANMDQTVDDADFVRDHGGRNEESGSGPDQKISWGRSQLDAATC